MNVPLENSGKIITRISVAKKKVTLYFGKEKLELSPDTFTNHYLFKGKELSLKEIESLKKENSYSDAYSYSLNLLSKGSYSEWKVREKLYKKEYSKDIVDEVIKRLKKDKMIDDEEYLKEYIEYANTRLIGKNKIIQELNSHGVFNETIDKVNFPYKTEIAKAKELLPKLEKKYSSLGYEDKRKHIYDSYIRMGYDNEIALEMLNHIKASSKKEEDEKLKRDFIKTFNLNKNRYQSKQDLKNSLIRSLARKGYSINQILTLWEEYEDEIAY